LIFIELETLLGRRELWSSVDPFELASNVSSVTVNANFDFTSFCSAYIPNAGGVGAATTTVYFASSATTTGVAATVTAVKTALTTITLPDPS
jgi:hypothetical protein